MRGSGVIAAEREMMLGLEPTVVGSAKAFECSYLDHVFTLRAMQGAVAWP
jgi:hypothetical protein